MAQIGVTNAIVLMIQPVRDIDYSVDLLTEDLGLVKARLYGGGKSHLRNFVLPWNSGELTYKITKKTFYSIEDFSINNYHQSISKSLEKIIIACACEEIITYTKVETDCKRFWDMTMGFIDGLDVCKTTYSCITAFYRFLWRYLSLLGLQPEIKNCANCGESFLLDNNKDKSAPNIYYDKTEHQFLCEKCGAIVDSNNTIPISHEALNYLNLTMNATYKTTQGILLSASSQKQLSHILFSMIEDACGRQLLSLKNFKTKVRI